MRSALCAVLLVGCASSSSAPPVSSPAAHARPAAAAPSAPAPFDRSSEDAFRASVRARLLAEDLVESAEPGDEPLVLMVKGHDGGRQQLNLHRVWGHCLRFPDQCESEVSNLLAALVRTDDFAPSREALVATLRAQDYVDNVRGQAPDAWTEPFTGDLAVVYAFDFPDRMRVATTADLATLGLTKPEAAALALANVEKAVGRADEIARQLSPGANAVVSKQSGLETSLLLQTEQWRAAAASLPCTLLATAADPAFLTITCGTDADVASLRQMAAAIFAHAERPLSSQVMVWRKDHWQVVP